MCGISGIIDRHGQPVAPERIRTMTDAAVHRGPDDSGYHLAGHVAFGHRRLSILDLSPRSRQPMSLDDRYWITYNGEVYNYPEIRGELERRGRRFVTTSDTEVILAAYAEWGPACLQRFNGMFAFAILDAADRTVFLARDRFGVKPLYYADDHREFRFASEIRQLLLEGPVRANQHAVVEWLLTCYDGHTPDTFFEGVLALPAGHWMRYDLGTHRYTIERWYTLRPDPDAAAYGEEAAVRALRDTLEDAVRIRLRSDVTVGTCLSGGLDSSATSAIASRLYTAASDRRFTGVHARSTDAERDESGYAAAVARHLDLDLAVVTPGVDDFVATLDDVVRTQEEPFGSPSMFMGWHVFREARARDCRVMLNGQGGDEVLLGYERYLGAFLRSLRLSALWRELRAQKAHTGLGHRQLIAQYVYFRSAAVRIARLRRRSFLRREIVNGYDFAPVRLSAASYRSVEELQLTEIQTLQLPHLLRYEDRNSMRHSVETRLPFLDYRLVELAVGLRPDLKVRDGWTKYALRKAIEPDLPAEVAWRTSKLGFEAPERTWIGSRGEQMKAEIAGSRILAEIADTRRLLANFDRLSLKERWYYFCVAAWERVHRVAWA